MNIYKYWSLFRWYMCDVRQRWSFWTETKRRRRVRCPFWRHGVAFLGCPIHLLLKSFKSFENVGSLKKFHECYWLKSQKYMKVNHLHFATTSWTFTCSETRQLQKFRVRNFFRPPSAGTGFSIAEARLLLSIDYQGVLPVRIGQSIYGTKQLPKCEKHPGILETILYNYIYHNMIWLASDTKKLQKHTKTIPTNDAF